MKVESKKTMNDSVMVVGDLHLGARNASMIVANFQIKAWEEQYFKLIKKHKVKDVIFTGDVFDSRKFSNHVILAEWKKRVFDYFQEHKIRCHIVLGNHDLALKNTTSINTPSLLLGEYKNIKVYDRPEVVEFGGLSILMVPWICLENHMECELMMKEAQALWCLGHFEIDGFEMHRGQTHTGGLGAETFKRFEQVLSGHFHTRSTKGNIRYVGTPAEMTWIDHGDTKGVHILNTKTRDLEFIPNNLTLFTKLYYDDKSKDKEYIKTFNTESLKDTYVKVMVVNKTDPYQFDQLMDKLYLVGCADLKIIEDMSDLESDSVEDDNIEMEDTVSLIESYIDSVDTEMDKDKLKKMMVTLYTESLEVLD
jgi:DNA repair exonuclease SbcCD nuclease subunit